jgi:hypothetical protein
MGYSGRQSANSLQELEAQGRYAPFAHKQRSSLGVGLPLSHAFLAEGMNGGTRKLLLLVRLQRQLSSPCLLPGGNPKSTIPTSYEEERPSLLQKKLWTQI